MLKREPPQIMAPRAALTAMAMMPSSPGGRQRLLSIGLAAIIRDLILTAGDGARLVHNDGRPWTLDEVGQIVDMTAADIAAALGRVPTLVVVDGAGTIAAPDFHSRRRTATIAAQNGAKNTHAAPCIKTANTHQEVIQNKHLPTLAETNKNTNPAPNSGATPETLLISPVPSRLPFPLLNSPTAAASALPTQADQPVNNPVDNLAHEHHQEHGSAVQEHAASGAIKEPLAAVHTPFDNPGDRPVQKLQSILADLFSSSGPLALWGKREWIQAALAAGIRFIADGSKIGACPRCIEDWMDTMVRDEYTDQRGRPIREWSHAEALLKSWANEWLRREIKAHRDPHSWKPAECKTCCKPGHITHNRVWIFITPGNEVRGLTVAEAVDLHRSGTMPKTRRVGCPDCHPRIDGRDQWWYKCNSFPLWVEPISILSADTAKRH